MMDLCPTDLLSSRKQMAKEQPCSEVMFTCTIRSVWTVLTNSLCGLFLIDVFQLVMHHHELTGAWIRLLCAWSTTSTSLGKNASSCHIESDCWDWYVEGVRHILESHALLDTFCCLCQFCFWPTDSGGSSVTFLPRSYGHLPLVGGWQYTHNILQSHCTHIWNRNHSI